MEDFKQRTDEQTDNKEVLTENLNEVKETTEKAQSNWCESWGDKNPILPTAKDIRREARIALIGNWKTALGVMVVAASIVFLVTCLTNSVTNWAMSPLLEAQNNGRLPTIEMITRYMLVMIPVLVILIFVSGVQTMVTARISRKLINYEMIDFSLIRLNMSDLFKGFRMSWVVLWRAFYIPMLWMCLAVLVEGILMAVVKLPDMVYVLVLMGAAFVCLPMVFRRIFSYLPIYQMWAIDSAASARELANRSKELMQGSCWRLFRLGVSFFGWIYLSLIVNVLLLMMLDGLTVTAVWSVFMLTWSYTTLPLMLYINTSVAAFVRDLMARKGMDCGTKKELAEEKTAK